MGGACSTLNAAIKNGANSSRWLTSARRPGKMRQIGLPILALLVAPSAGSEFKKVRGGDGFETEACTR
jgi:hypothetical protein